MICVGVNSSVAAPVYTGIEGKDPDTAKYAPWYDPKRPNGDVPPRGGEQIDRFSPVRRKCGAMLAVFASKAALCRELLVALADSTCFVWRAAKYCPCRVARC
jgi:hypothetical protein